MGFRDCYRDMGLRHKIRATHFIGEGGQLNVNSHHFNTNFIFIPSHKFTPIAQFAIKLIDCKC